ncbi:MAG: type II toxin-antitoxin system RelE/ParE family toxin [Candidatus Omnitrophica bacterium]|nr:type II toxin-antitoxin system RelE/ParE family toxin [Candidatus Omnitrophota bacterium]
MTLKLVRVLLGERSNVDRFEVVLLGQAEKFYNKASDDLVDRLNLCFEDLEISPFQGPNIKLLKTPKSVRWYRYRVGKDRVVYEIDREAKKVGVILILHRSSVYRGM